VKKFALAATLVIFMAVAAEAQITVTYTRQTSHSRLTLSNQGGSYYNYGYGGYGYGYGGTYRSAVGPGVVAGAYHPWGAGYSYGYPGSSYSYYSGPVRPVMDYYPGVPRSERSPENVTSLLLDQARKRIRMGDYRGAVDDVRSAVVADPAGGRSEAWFALALAIAGEGRVADKALRAALGHGFKGRLELQLRDKKEEARIAAALLKADGEATAYALSLLGQPEKLEKLAEKNTALKPLLPPAAK
jgi:hypothetical protein